MNNVVLRLGSFAVGIALARLLSPEEFGVYAVALTVQAVLMTLADLGLSADLIRSENPASRAPTVATLGLATGAVLTGIVIATSNVVARSLGSPSSAPVIVALAFTLVLAGAGVVPYAMLLRDFRQERLFGLAVVDFLVSTIVTLTLISANWGPLSLAVGRLAAQSVVLVLQYLWSGVRPRFGADREVGASVLAFGLPIAGANLLSWVLINVDNIVIARGAGPVALGFYVLAFNISNWPMSAIGQVVRSVALPGFARTTAQANDPSLARVVAPTWALALPAGAMLVALAEPLILSVYGDVWLPSTPVLMSIGLFGSLRVVFDLMVAYLLARGASGAVLLIQLWWLVALTPALIFSTHRWGIAGAGWAHVLVAAVLILPAYLWAVRRSGATIIDLLQGSGRPTIASTLAAGAGYAVASQFSSSWPALGAGALTGAVIYTALMAPWARRLISDFRPSEAVADPEPAVGHVAGQPR